RVFAAIEDVDVVLAVDADRGDVAEFPAVGQPGPVLDDAIAVLAAAKYYGHSSLHFLCHPERSEAPFLLPERSLGLRPRDDTLVVIGRRGWRPRSSRTSSAPESWCWRRAPRGRPRRRRCANPARP